MADSLPPTGVEVALICPSGKLFRGCTVAYPSFPATASPISTSLLSYSFTVEPTGAFTLTSAGILACPVKLLSIRAPDVNGASTTFTGFHPSRLP